MAQIKSRIINGQRVQIGSKAETELLARGYTPETEGPTSAKTGDPVAGGIKLPQSDNANQGGKAFSSSADSLGISSSLPAVDRKDIERNTKKEFAGTRQAIINRADLAISEASEEGKQQTRALEGQMGTNRRFSSSAQAFITFVNEKNNKRIAELELNKEDAIANFDFQLASLIDKRISDERQAQKDELDYAIKLYDLAERQTKAKQAEQQPVLEATIGKLLQAGVDDPVTISQIINFDEDGSQINNYTFEQIGKTIEKAKLDREEINKLIVDLGKTPMVPPEVIASVSKANSLSQAVALAGDYLQTGSGIIGEYMLYKREALSQGQVPISFNDYQTMDANRKRPVTVVGGGNMTSGQESRFLTITNKYQADPLIMAATKGKTAIAIADQVLADPNNAANQLKALYVLVKNLDPDSAVREGELALAQQTQSYFQRFKTSITRIEKGQVLSPDAAALLATATKDLASAWNETAIARTKQYQAQAKNIDPVVGDAFDSYLSDFDSVLSTKDEAIENEAQAKTRVQTIYPQYQEQIDAILADDPSITYSELLQILGQ